MRIKINVDIELSPRVKRALLIAVPAVVMVAASVAYAGVPNTFKDGDTLSAAGINDDFAALDKRLETAEGRLSTKVGPSYKAGATYCGSTAGTTGDLAGISGSGAGYLKTKNACQAACAGSMSAHMCSAEEMVHGASLDIHPAASGWYATGVSREYLGSTEGYECFGYTSKDGSRIGSVWSDGNQPSTAICSSSYPVLCCD